MFLLIIDPVSAADHGIAKPVRSPGKTDPRAEVIAVRREKAAAVRRCRRSDELGDRESVLPDVDDPVVELPPALEIVVAQPECQCQIRCRLPFIVDVISLPHCIHINHGRHRIDGGAFQVAKEKIGESAARESSIEAVKTSWVAGLLFGVVALVELGPDL